MDIYCPVCGEPWENDSLHEEVSLRQQAGETATYAKVSGEFRQDGCKAFREFGASPCVREESPEGGITRGELAALAYDLLGDDMDGAASMLDDYDFLVG